MLKKLLEWFEDRKWYYPQPICKHDPNKKCPYRMQISFYGAVEVDTQSIFKCCTFKKQIEQMKELEREINNSGR